MDYFDSYKEMLQLRGLTEHTLISYSTYIKAYLDYLNKTGIAPEKASWENMREFILCLQTERSLADRTINAVISQLRFFRIYVLHQNWDPYQIPFRKFDTYMPYVPEQDQVFKFISTIDDIKFKTLIILMYSAGLRSGEVRHLRYEDISRSQGRIHVARGKSRYDRYAVLSDRALNCLTDYWFACSRPRNYLFPSSQKRDGKEVPVSSQYMSSKIREHEDFLGWEHKITAHTFRHAFATHLYENGADLLTIKSLLGHRSLNSTTIYIHLAKKTLHQYPNPFDRMMETFE